MDIYPLDACAFRLNLSKQNGGHYVFGGCCVIGCHDNSPAPPGPGVVLTITSDFGEE